MAIAVDLQTMNITGAGNCRPPHSNGQSNGKVGLKDKSGRFAKEISGYLGRNTRTVSSFLTFQRMAQGVQFREEDLDSLITLLTQSQKPSNNIIEILSQNKSIRDKVAARLENGDSTLVNWIVANKDANQFAKGLYSDERIKTLIDDIPVAQVKEQNQESNLDYVLEQVIGKDNLNVTAQINYYETVNIENDAQRNKIISWAKKPLNIHNQQAEHEIIVILSSNPTLITDENRDELIKLAMLPENSKSGFAYGLGANPNIITNENIDILIEWAKVNDKHEFSKGLAYNRVLFNHRKDELLEWARNEIDKVKPEQERIEIELSQKADEMLVEKLAQLIQIEQRGLRRGHGLSDKTIDELKMQTGENDNERIEAFERLIKERLKQSIIKRFSDDSTDRLKQIARDNTKEYATLIKREIRKFKIKEINDEEVDKLKEQASGKIAEFDKLIKERLQRLDYKKISDNIINELREKAGNSVTGLARLVKGELRKLRIKDITGKEIDGLKAQAGTRATELVRLVKDKQKKLVMEGLSDDMLAKLIDKADRKVSREITNKARTDKLQPNLFARRIYSLNKSLEQEIKDEDTVTENSPNMCSDEDDDTFNGDVFREIEKAALTSARTYTEPTVTGIIQKLQRYKRLSTNGWYQYSGKQELPTASEIGWLIYNKDKVTQEERMEILKQIIRYEDCCNGAKSYPFEDKLLAFNLGSISDFLITEENVVEMLKWVETHKDHNFTAGFVQNSSIIDLLEAKKEPDLLERFKELQDSFSSTPLEEDTITKDLLDMQSADLVL